MGPEMCLQHEGFRGPLKSPEFCYARRTNKDIEVKGCLEEELMESHNVSR